MSQDANKTTIEAYESGLDAYNAAAIPKVEGSVKEWIDAALGLILHKGNVLELGSAHGRDADYIEGLGYAIQRTDAAQSFVTYMQRHGHDAQLLNALTDNYGGPYDMVYANAVLLHFTSEQIELVLQKN